MSEGEEQRWVHVKERKSFFFHVPETIGLGRYLKGYARRSLFKTDQMQIWFNIKKHF